jgi:serine protease Do
MYQFRGLLGSLISSFLVFITITTNAQAINNNQLKNINSYISDAVNKGYQASVLIWEIDAESSARKSAQFSGVVVSRDGVVLSAAHVVMPGKTYKVMFADGRECVAKGLGRITIPPTFMLPDAAMLQIADKGTWPFAEMGWSSSLTVNTPCISIAYPESLEQRKPTVRFGHITQLKNKHGFLQSSCVMEPGDSGGPLFDLLGRVIGIHSGIETAENINYEVPINTYRKFWSALSKPIDYTSLPADTAVLSADPLIGAIKAVPQSKDFLNTINSKGLKLQPSCVRVKSVIDGKEQQILGTLISTEGLTTAPGFANKTLLLTKNSMVGESPVIMLPDGKTVKGDVIARSRVDDLGLLQADKIGLKGITIDFRKNDTIGFQDVGTFLISPRPDSAARIGVLGSELLNLPKITSYGYVGATTGLKGDKLVFTYIQPNSAAQTGGLQQGDELHTVDGNTVEDQLDFLKALQKYSAGDTTTINIIREGKEYSKIIILKYPPERKSGHPAELFAGGKSLRRDGFNQVFIHDSAILATECGGPVFNAEGDLIGINIARLSRTSTVAIPASTIKAFVKSSLKSKK